jgi:hypothetical protein
MIALTLIDFAATPVRGARGLRNDCTIDTTSAPADEETGAPTWRLLEQAAYWPCRQDPVEGELKAAGAVPCERAVLGVSPRNGIAHADPKRACP